MRAEDRPSPLLRDAGSRDRVSIAVTDDDLQEIGRLRYELYIEKAGKKYAFVDHARKSFLEPIDTTSLNFQVKLNGSLVGTVRGSRAIDALSDDHLCQLIDAANLPSLESVFVTSRLAFRPSRAARSLIHELFAVVYLTGRSMGGKQCLASAKDELVPLFERFGFKSNGCRFTDSAVGDLTVLIHDMEDIEHMHRISSPLLSIARAYRSASGGAE